MINEEDKREAEEEAERMAEYYESKADKIIETHIDPSPVAPSRFNRTPAAPQPPAVVLTEEQNLAVTLIMTWFLDEKSPPMFKLGGYAGTGKTTLVKFLINEIKKNHTVVVSAFTGKAVNVLERKGIWAQTLHSLMYSTEIIKGVYHFHLKHKLDADPDLIIVDEASMISSDLLRDLQSFKRKMLFVGDPGQLEPVGDNPNLMAHPDFVLKKIHRQAESSPIITFATQVRLGGVINHNIMGQNGATSDLIIKPKSLTPSESVEYTQLIVAKNKTRNLFNEKIRLFKRLPPKTITVGEKIICLKNNMTLGIFNGMILFVDQILRENDESWTVEAHDETGKAFAELPIWKMPFQQEVPKDFYKPKKLAECDFAYAITCHKSQGSEWDKVIVYDEWMPPHIWDMKRWRYTAITRAAKQLLYLI